MYGLPDSWWGYGAKKALRALRNIGRSGRRALGGRRTTRRVGTKYYYKFDRVIIYDSVLKSYLNTPAGDPWLLLDTRGRMAHAMAKKDVGVKTGRLRNSIYYRHVGHANGQFIQIGSDVEYAYDHHQGTRPHIIKSKPGGPDLLKFRKSGGGFAYTRYVRHPGTRGNPFLAKQLPRFFGDLGSVYIGTTIPKPPTGT